MSAERLGARYIRKLEKHRSDFAIELLGFLNRICVRPKNLHLYSSMINFFIEKRRKNGFKIAMSILDIFSIGRYLKNFYRCTPI